MTPFRIEQLFIYPVRSLGGMAVSEARVSAGGSLGGDREWIVTSPDGGLIWQGDIPRMTLLSARLDGTSLVLHGHDGTIGPPAVDAPDRTAVRQDGYDLSGFDQGDAVADWLSDQLQSPCRLVRTGEEAHLWGGLNPIHAVSLVSLAVLNARLTERGEQPVEVERFRPNVVFSGAHAAFDEETAGELIFDHASLELREPCVRCELPNISREDASRGRQPLKLIGAMSRERPAARPASFGTYCIARGNVLRVGMCTIV
ncbi:MAG: MOSC domain-containing protein [Alphaproteobacteria bacterium]|nr:MAG: MOSC domain-containing protein [Alphaproteobacteria bacterium]